MSKTEQLLPSISALVALGEFAQGDQLSDTQQIKTVSDTLTAAAKQQRAEQEWQAAIAALGQLLAQPAAGNYSDPNTRASKRPSPARRAKKSARSAAHTPQALIISGPVPLLNDSTLIGRVSNWTLVPRSSAQLASTFDALSPMGRLFQKQFKKQPTTRLLPLLEDDPLVQEQFSLVLTPHFSLVLVLGKDADDELRFQFSFMPRVVTSVWRILRSRIRVIRPHQLDFIDPLVEKFAPSDPDYRIVSQFNRWMLACRPHEVSQSTGPSISQTQFQSTAPPAGSNVIASPNGQGRDPSAAGSVYPETAGAQFSDSELLKAMAHEIRTPLTTIRTYTRSLLKRQNLDPQVIKRLQSIDRECTQQIDRFSLIFRAVELEAASQSPKSPLSAIALHQVFQEAIPQWQQAARRRNLSLEVGLPPELPMVASDPNMLQHVLTGLVELFTHSVSPGSHIQLHVLHAGEQLKLQFQSQVDPSEANTAPACAPPPLQSLGHLLMFQPDTGGLSLNLEATKNLFHALGAKLTVRERSNQGTTWTVFLPLETSGLKSYPIV
ncbi:MAG: HAMP domain-containing sensor histidine kinase [Phormidesmis sp.]